jgi:hypothetical protein
MISEFAVLQSLHQQAWLKANEWDLDLPLHFYKEVAPQDIEKAIETIKRNLDQVGIEVIAKIEEAHRQ